MIGKLRYPVEIERVTLTQDPNTGEVTESWSRFAKVWARILGISGREFLAAAAEQSSTTYRMTAYYRGDIDTAMRVKHQGQHYNIRAILPDDRQVFMTLMLERI